MPSSCSCDHLNAVWTLPEGDADFSTRRARVKRSFTRAQVREGGWEGTVSDGVYDATWCCGCDGRTTVKLPDFDGLDAEGIEAAFGE